MPRKLITVGVVCVLAFFAFPLIAGISSAIGAALGGLMVLGLLGAVQFPLLWYATRRSRFRIARPDEERQADDHSVQR